MIWLSAHKDVVFHPFKFSYSNAVFTGLLDNFIGILTSLVVTEDPNLILIEKRGKIKLHFGDSEEWGTLINMPTLKKEDIVLVIDVASGTQYKNIDVSLENISGFTKEKITELKESLQWEGFKIKTKVYDGNPDDEDEAWYWREKKIPVISFIIPINDGSKDTGWHVDNCTMQVEKLVKSKQILKRLINYLL